MRGIRPPAFSEAHYFPERQIITNIEHRQYQQYKYRASHPPHKKHKAAMYASSSAIPSTPEAACPSSFTSSCRSSFASCARLDLPASFRASYADLAGPTWPVATPPIVYHEDYNIGFFGVENLHPFDSKKYGKVLASLQAAGIVAMGVAGVVTPCEATLASLRIFDVHSESYLQSLETSSLKVAIVTELAPLALVPASLLRKKVLRPMRLMAGGTALAAALALERGWAINLGGGMHHAWHDNGGGWCPYDDIYLAVVRARQAGGTKVQRILVVDLDVHQGNGVARDKAHHADTGLFILDVYNREIYPQDRRAIASVDLAVEVRSGAEDEEYLEAVQSGLGEAFRRFPCPDLVIYNAGTDILAGDPLGRLGVSAAGVAARDAAVWRAALSAGSPVCMILSGGYSRASAACIASSLVGLVQEFGLVGGE
jgi:histone deacetylase 11